MAKIGNGACTNCSNDVWYYSRVFIVLLVQLVLVANAVRGTMTISKEFKDNQKLSLNGAVLIRVLTNYFQLISLVSGLPITWPGAIRSISTASSQISSVSENVFTLDCMFHSDYVSGVKVVFIKILLTTAGPFGLILLGILGTAAYFKYKRDTIFKNKAFENRIVSIAVIICFMTQPSAIQSAFSLFRCDNLYREDNPVYYLQKDYEVVCWEGPHLIWALGFGLPMLVIWAIALPAIVFTILRKNKTKLKSIENAQKYSFLYGGYSYDRYYWELVIMFRKFLLITIIIAASFHSTNLEIYISVLLVMFCYGLQLFTHPYAEANLNRLEQLSLLSAGIVNFCGLYFKFIRSLPALDTIVIIVGLGGNLIFLIYFGMLYFALQIEKLKQNEKVIKVVTALSKKCKWLNLSKLENMLQRATEAMEKLGSTKTEAQHLYVKEGFSKEEQEKEALEDQSPVAFKSLPMMSIIMSDNEKAGSQPNEILSPISPLQMSLEHMNFEKPHEQSEIGERRTLKNAMEVEVEVVESDHCIEKIEFDSLFGQNEGASSQSDNI